MAGSIHPQEVRRSADSTDGKAMDRLSLTAKLGTLIAVALAGLLLLGLVSYRTLEEVKVNGPVYARIVQAKDVVADILPPPEYILEAYMVTLQMLDETDPAVLRKLAERGVALAKDYDDRHQFWIGDLPPGELKDKLLRASYDPAVAFFDVRDKRFVPAMLAGDAAKAREILRKEMTPLYEKHRAAIDEVVVLSNERGKQDEELARTAVARGAAQVVGLGLVLALIVVSVGVFIARGLVTRIRRTMNVLEAVASGDLEQRLDDAGADEIGRMAVALNAAVAESRQTLVGVRESAERERQRAAAVEHRVAGVLDGVAAAQDGDLGAAVECDGDDAVARLGAGIGALLDRFRTEIAEIAGAAHTLAAASEELTAVSREMVRQAGETSTVAQNATELSSRIAGRIRDVSSSSAEIGHNIRAIASSAQEARKAATDADSVAQAANQRIAELDKASTEINEVVKVITSIAEQTNLLALNATIEAARAGEAGKGFSVVAGEVKNLAKDTADATNDVGEKIATIRLGIEGAVAAIGTIGETITRIAEIQGTVAAAVENQTSVTRTIDQTASEVAGESASMAGQFGRVAASAGDTRRGADQIDAAAAEVAQMAVRLQTLVSKFRIDGPARAAQASDRTLDQPWGSDARNDARSASRRASSVTLAPVALSRT
jgi:methyl-accepting chemotaxis protein